MRAICWAVWALEGEFNWPRTSISRACVYVSPSVPDGICTWYLVCPFGVHIIIIIRTTQRHGTQQRATCHMNVEAHEPTFQDWYVVASNYDNAHSCNTNLLKSVIVSGAI